MINGLEDIEAKFSNIDSGIFFLKEGDKVDGKWRICATCYVSCKKGKVPNLNIKKLDDFVNIGALPYDLPKLNTLEAYLIKLRIPFLRLANMPRSPNLKVFGSMVCVTANIESSMQKIGNRLQLHHENLIPVNFKRKLVYTGSYLSKIIDASKVFTWLDYLKIHNPLYKNLIYDRDQLTNDIKSYENQLVREAAHFDDKNRENNQNEEDEYDTDDSNSDDDITDDENIPKLTENIKEAITETQDTLLVDVRQANITEDTLTNHVADAIIAQEKELFFSDEENVYSDTSDEKESTTATTPEPNEEDMIKKQKENKTTKKMIKKKNTLKSMKWSNTLKKSKKEKVLNVAPGEGGKINNIGKFCESECFPELFPKGTGTYLSYLESK